jgi:hypothetical protein
MHCVQSRRSNDRRIRHRAFKSVFVHPPQPAPFKYFLDSREYARTIGCTERTIQLWRKEWLSRGYGPGVEPIKINCVYRYPWESVTQSSEGTFLALMKKDRSRFTDRGSRGYEPDEY